MLEEVRTFLSSEPIRRVIALGVVRSVWHTMTVSLQPTSRYVSYHLNSGARLSFSGFAISLQVFGDLADLDRVGGCRSA